MSDSFSTLITPNRRLKVSFYIYYGLLASLIVIPAIFTTISTLIVLPLLPFAPFIILSGDRSLNGVSTFMSNIGTFYDTTMIPAIFIAAFISGCWMTVESMIAFKSATSQRTRIFLILSISVFILPWLLVGLLLFSKMQMEK